MAIKLMKKSITDFWYTPESKDDGAAKGSFLLRPLNGVDSLRAITEVGDGLRLSYNGITFILRKCLKDWKGVVDETGADIPFSDELVDYLPPLIRQRIAEKLAVDAILSDDERKN